MLDSARLLQVVLRALLEVLVRRLDFPVELPLLVSKLLLGSEEVFRRHQDIREDKVVVRGKKKKREINHLGQSCVRLSNSGGFGSNNHRSSPRCAMCLHHDVIC